MTIAHVLATSTVAYENRRRANEGIPPIANPGDWVAVLESQYECALHAHHGIFKIAKDATNVAH